MYRKQAGQDGIGGVAAGPGGVPDRYGAAACTPRVGERAAYDRSSVGVLLTVSAVVAGSPVIGQLTQRVVASVRHQGRVQQRVETVGDGKPETVGDDHEGAPATRPTRDLDIGVADLKASMALACDGSGP